MSLRTGLRNFGLFAIGCADTFDGCITAMGMPMQPCPVGLGTHMIAAPTLIITVGLGLILSHRQEIPHDVLGLLVFATLGSAVVIGVLVWPLFMAEFNWWNFRRRFPDRAKQLEV